ncbi:hypothetical protein ZIOFF_033668 [Zingiber officinale]|uniref:Uncharacterized protein n=1 Tax=Zingiber officinale TaxID=94328 RepID=A0A8J5L1Y3_ZINOF|nr:hypothetical protein ZIOFF_033668 [Zingiber officinale]
MAQKLAEDVDSESESWCRSAVRSTPGKADSYSVARGSVRRRPEDKGWGAICRAKEKTDASSPAPRHGGTLHHHPPPRASLHFIPRYFSPPTLSLLPSLTSSTRLFHCGPPSNSALVDQRCALLADLRVIACIAPLFLTLAAFFALAMTYNATGSLSPSQLFRQIARRYCQTLVTRLYVLLLTLGLALPSTFFFDAAAMAEAVAGTVGASIALLYLYGSTPPLGG